MVVLALLLILDIFCCHIIEKINFYFEARLLLPVAWQISAADVEPGSLIVLPSCRATLSSEQDHGVKKKKTWPTTEAFSLKVSCDTPLGRQPFYPHTVLGFLPAEADVGSPGVNT